MATAAAKAVWGTEYTNKSKVDSNTQTKTSNISHTYNKSDPIANPTRGIDTSPSQTSKGDTASSLPEPSPDQKSSSGNGPSPAVKIAVDESSTRVAAPKDQDDITGEHNNPPGPAPNGSDAENTGDRAAGDGPRPLADVARDHGRDAGLVGKIDDVGGDEAENGAEHNDENNPRKIEALGTGEKYVRSSGLHANGGDFDAANPGAGLEADRLRTEMGVHIAKSDDNDDDEEENDHKTDDATGEGKLSLGKRIKAKYRTRRTVNKGDHP